MLFVEKHELLFTLSSIRTSKSKDTYFYKKLQIGDFD